MKSASMVLKRRLRRSRLQRLRYGLHGLPEVHYHIDLVDHADPELPAWTEHPTLGAKADLVTLPVKELANIIGEANSVSLDAILSQGNWHRWDVGSELQVIGYPYRQVGGPFPIWSKGFIASEPGVNIGGLPIIFIDCRSRQGQSGSPVWAWFKKREMSSRARARTTRQRKRRTISLASIPADCEPTQISDWSGNEAA